MKNGIGLESYKNHAFEISYTGYFKDDLRHGKGELCYKDGTIINAHWENGVI